MLLLGIIVLGIGLFYQQQLTNAAREGARYAAIHSATARCPTVSNRAPDAGLLPLPYSYSACDAPGARWPFMSANARARLFGMDAASMQLTACWSGYWTRDTGGNWASYDQVASQQVAPYAANEFRECTVPVYGWCKGSSGASTLLTINPRNSVDVGCPGVDKTVAVDCTRPFPVTTIANDMASSFAASNSTNANQVTVLTCYAWKPPLAGFLAIPSTIDMVAVVTETLQYQQ